ncbi:MAG TPA: GGDEF domain-containing protein [Myxococcales bacterium]|nr:GGDEF domain-containing protein [Myxococcales bacterium]
MSSGQTETRVTKVSTIGTKFEGGQSCLVVIYGPDLGHRYELANGELTIGRDIGNNITVDLDNVSRRHARLLQREEKVYVQDLGSTNGTFLNDEEVKGEVPLRSGDLVKVGGAIFKFLYGGNVESLFHEEIYRITIGDGLTQCFNKRYFMEFLEREMARGQRYGRPLSLMMFDLDHFKKVNDTHGHLAGDHVLREMAHAIRGKVRKEECLARYGGEEFALVSPESGPARVRKFAEKLRQIVEGHEFAFDGKSIPVTISVGVADMTPAMTDPAHFIKVADANLYLAKKQGRNRVVG